MFWCVIYAIHLYFNCLTLPSSLWPCHPSVADHFCQTEPAPLCFVYFIKFVCLTLSGLDSPAANSFNRMMPRVSPNSTYRSQLYSPDYKSWLGAVFTSSSTRHLGSLIYEECASNPQQESCGKISLQMLVQKLKKKEYII